MLSCYYFGVDEARLGTELCDGLEEVEAPSRHTGIEEHIAKVRTIHGLCTEASKNQKKESRFDTTG